ncbi:MAG: ABC transporter ATP-binding protein [Bacillota bacterium]|nr:ABC transporter ATP-binding protein [Bacillota bacterium]
MTEPSGKTEDVLLQVHDLSTEFMTEDGLIRVVDGVSFAIARGETLGMVGESGSGKSVTSLSIMRLLPPRSGRVAGGQVLFEGRDLLSLDEAQMRHVRGYSISMIFQEPMTSLNPVFTVGFQIAEALKVHQGLDDKQGWAKAVDLLSTVGIPLPQRRVHEYPHQLSGGMRQRVMIAMALACNPKLLIADEPTTALDVTVQAQILDLMRRLKDDLGMSILLITHDLGVIAEMAKRVVVMYAGRVVEEADVDDIFNDPLHPYTRGLLSSIPTLDSPRGDLHVIEGVVPSPFAWPSGCRFHPRCPEAIPACAEAAPSFIPAHGGRRVACIKYDAGREKVGDA